MIEEIVLTQGANAATSAIAAPAAEAVTTAELANVSSALFSTAETILIAPIFGITALGGGILALGGIIMFEIWKGNKDARKFKDKQPL